MTDEQPEDWATRADELDDTDDADHAYTASLAALQALPSWEELDEDLSVERLLRV
jgi:hypothetical protein